MRRYYYLVIALSGLLLGCPGGGGPGIPAAAPSINSVTPSGEIGFVTDAITFTADITGTVTSYQWTFTGGFSLASSTEAAPMGTLDVEGSFDGSLVACNGAECSDPFGFSYTVGPEPGAIPQIIAVLPSRTTWPVGSWIAPEAIATGVPETFEWLILDPAGTELFLDHVAGRVPAFQLLSAGRYVLEVRAGNALGMSGTFEVAFTATSGVATSRHSFVQPPALDQFAFPNKAFGYGDRAGIIWTSETLDEVWLSGVATPMIGSDFALLPLPADIVHAHDAVLIDNHLLLAGRTAANLTMIAIARESFPASPATWDTYTLPIDHAGMQLAASATSLALVPELPDTGTDPDPIGIARISLPRVASDWSLGSFPELPLAPASALTLQNGYRSTIHGDQLLLFAVLGQEPCCGIQEDLTRRLICASLPMSADPANSANWQMGVVLESEPDLPIHSLPYLARTPGDQLVLPVCRGNNLHIASPLVPRPLTPAQWEFTPSLEAGGLFPMPQNYKNETLQSIQFDYRLGYLEDAAGRQCILFPAQLQGVGFTTYQSLLRIPSLDPASDSLIAKQLAGGWFLLSSPSSGRNEQRLEFLDASLVGGRVRIISATVSQMSPPSQPPRFGESFLNVDYLDWPTL